ncbi:DUF1156 domain-containing protein [Chondromyces crocatus]|uniref:DUF1156 domain-containing protein n=1 Tax=Chondromyces crocatus TaxID=52 RepID=A0A0K1ENL7_CHOCO|nr:DUF1156 domain-containing protein [Chondromyces crocatus]AKT42525.1 uncharacterized protein CMC5_067510 [Chondromyces crocatus]
MSALNLHSPKRLIEVDLPIRRISEHARREKSIRHGHLSTLHLWWARRPLGACRAVLCASLWPAPTDGDCPPAFITEARRLVHAWATDNAGKSSPESFSRLVRIQKNPEILADAGELQRALLDFIADFANWDNSTDQAYLRTARALTASAHQALSGGSARPVVVDPFAGGGSIPLEALRVGADAFASDLNPIPVLLNRVLLEYVPKFGADLATELRRAASRLRERALADVRDVYPPESEGGVPAAYLWARTARCEGPGCGYLVPLQRSPLISGKAKPRSIVELRPDAKRLTFDCAVVELSASARVPDGTVKRGALCCPACGYTTPADRVRAQFKGRRSGARDAQLLAVVVSDPRTTGRRFRSPTPYDLDAVAIAQGRLNVLPAIDGLPAVPDEPLPYLRSIFNIHLLDATTWGDLFTARQALTLSTLARHCPEACEPIKDMELRQAVQTCVALLVDRCADYWSSLARWVGEFVANTFGRQALGIIWDFAEVYPFSDSSGNFDGALEWIVRVIEREALSQSPTGSAVAASATAHPLPDDSAALVFTDPPYYDAVPYADLSDFFFVWLKRSLRRVHPDLLAPRLTEKRGEIVQLAERNKDYAFKTREYFETEMRKAMADARRVLAPSGLGVVVFAHKTTVGWETQLQAMIDAGWILTASWPIDTERPGRLRANNAAALASSVHLVCRPRENPDGTAREGDVGSWREILAELPVRIHEWMPRLAAEGVVGADAIFACLGPALEVFSRYSHVEKASGERVLLREYLEQVWACVSREALATVLRDSDAGALEPDARVSVMMLWTLGGRGGDDGPPEEVAPDVDGDDEDEAGSKASGTGFVLEYDATRKIAQGLGARLDELQQVVEIKGDKARLLGAIERTGHLFGRTEGVPTAKKAAKKKQMTLFGDLDQAAEAQGWGEVGAPKAATTTLDRVHQAMLLFGSGRGEALKRFIVEEGVGKQPQFWKLAQSLSALYPGGTDEKRWVDGVLARKKGLGF